MKNILNCSKFKKAITIVCCTLLLLCGSLSFNIKKTYALTTDEKVQEIDIGTFIMPKWVENGGSVVKSAWLSVLTTGVTGAVLAVLRGAYKFMTTNEKSAFDLFAETFNKVSTTTKTLFMFYKLIGIAEFTNPVVQQKYGNKSLQDLYDDALHYDQESDIKSFYDGREYEGDDIVAKTGATTRTDVYDDGKLFNPSNNSNVAVSNDYSYDITNNTFNFNSIVGGNSYSVSNKVNYVEIATLLNSSEEKLYKMYYSLPNGTNSYNLTEDEINGIKTDLTIATYNNVVRDEKVLYLNHLDGNNLNVANNGNQSVSLPSFSGYVDTGIFNLGGFSNTQSERFSINNTEQVTLSLRFMPSWDGYFGIELNGTTLISYEENKSYNWISNVNQLTIDGNESEIQVVNIPNASTNPSQQQLNTFCQGYFGDNSYAVGYSTSTKNVACNISKTNQSNLNFRTYAVEIDSTYVKNINSITMTDTLAINNNSWNYLTLTLYNTNKAMLTINGKNTGIFNLPSNTYTSSNIRFVGSGTSYVIYDEIGLFKSGYLPSTLNPIMPFTDNSVYTLPQSASNNTILLKSTLNIQRWQIGGVRKDIPSYSGQAQAYVHIDDNDCIDSIQVWTPSINQWVSVDGAIYSVDLGKWVNAIGYSVVPRQYEHTEVPSDVVGNDGIIEKSINTLKDTITNGFANIGNFLNDLILGDLVHIDGINDISIGDTLTNSISDVNELNDDISIDTDMDNFLADDYDNVKLLADTTINPLFNIIEENNLNYIWIVPLVICIVRLVI